MKSKFIRVLTFVLCLAMLLTSMSVFTVTAAGNVITPTGVQQYVDRDYDWLIWLKNTGTLPSTAGCLYGEGVVPTTLYDANGNVLASTAQGNLRGSFLQDGDTWLCPMIHGDYAVANAPAEGYVIIMEPGTYASNKGDGTAITLEYSVVLHYTGGQFVLCDGLPADAVKLTSLVVLPGASTNAGLYTGIATGTPLTFDGDWKNRFLPTDPISGIFYTQNGTTTRVYPDGLKDQGMPVENYNEGTAGIGGGIYLNGWTQAGLTPVAGDVVTVRGNWYSENTGEYLTFPEPLSFEFNGTNWNRHIVYTTYTGTLTVKGSELETSTNNSGFWIKGSESLNGSFENDYTDGVWNQVYLTPVDGEANGAFLNGNRVNVSLQQYSWSKQYYYVSGMNAQAGDVFEIKGTFVNEANATKIVFENTRFLWNGTNWVDDVVDTTVYNDMTLTELYAATSGTSADSWTFNFKVDGTWPSNAADFEEYTDPIVYINDTALNPGVIQTFRNKSGDYAYFMLKLWGSLTDHKDPVAGDTVTIKAAKIKYAADESVGVNITEDFVIRYNGSEWVNPNEKVYNELTLGDPLSSVDFRCDAPNVPGSWDYNYAGLTVTLNGNPFTNFELKKPNDVYFKMHGVELVRGDVVTISGQSDCTSHPEQAGIKLTAPATYYWDGETWVTELDLTVYETITFNGSNFGWFAEKNWWDCYFFTNETVPGTTWETVFNGLTVVIDGVSSNLPLKKAGEHDLNLFANENVTAPAVGATVVIKAGKAKSNDGSNGIQLLEDAVFVWDGEKLVPEDQYDPYIDVQTSFSGFDVETKRESDWVFYIDLTTALPGSAWAVVNGTPEAYRINVTVDGALYEGIEAKNAGGLGLYFALPFSTLPASGNHTLVIKAGSYASNVNNHGFTLAADYTIYANQFGLSTIDFIAPSTSVKPSLIHTDNNGVNGFYVLTSEDDGAEFGSWDVSTYANGMTDDAQTRYLGENGFFVDGAQVIKGDKVTGIMKKLATNKYYVGLLDVGANTLVSVGTRVVIKGLFHDQNGYLVEFEESAFIYNGTVWEQDRSAYTVYNGKFFIGKPDSEGGNGAQVPSTPSYGAPNGLYLKGSDSLAGALAALVGDGENWNVAYLTPVDNAFAFSLQNYNATKNYYHLAGMGSSVEAGTQLVIKGQFCNDLAKVIVNVTESVFEWNGTKWVDVMTSTVEKDVNADGEVNALDVVWMTRYLADPAIGISNKGDINGDGTVNATDLRILRRYVLGINIVVVNGVAQGTPYYAGGETTKIAYVAPVLGSFDTATETLTFKSDEEIDRLMDEYAAVGFTHIVTEKAAYLYDQAADYVGQQLLYRYYEEAAERGMKVIVVSGYMDYLRTYEGDLSAIVYPNGNTWKNIVDDIIYNQSKHEAFAGFMLGDEPTDAEEKNYIEIIEYVREKHPDVLVWYAAFPNYVSSAGVADYADYVKTHGVANGHFMYDNYALRTKTSWLGSSTDYYLETYWFTNLLTVAELGRDYGFTTGVTMQSVALQESGGGWFQNSYQTRPIKKQSDIGFQVYTALAYGMKELDFFTYMNHWSDEMVDDTAMIKTDGSKNDSYYYVQNVYNNIKAMEAALLNFKWLGTIEKNLKTGSDNSSLTNSTYKWSNNSRLAADPSISGAAVVGCLKDEIDGFDGFMIANAQEPYNGGNSTVTLTFSSASKAMVYAADGSVSTVNLTNGQYSVTLAAGTGCFVIPMV